MAYDGRVLRQATLRFDEDKQRRQEQQRQRHAGPFAAGQQPVRELHRLAARAVADPSG